MQVTIKFEDNGKPVVLTGDFDEVTESKRFRGGLNGREVRTLWFDMSDELGFNYEMSVFKQGSSGKWHVSHGFRWAPGADCYEYEIDNDEYVEITISK